jgi:hypothetical protein
MRIHGKQRFETMGNRCGTAEQSTGERACQSLAGQFLVRWAFFPGKALGIVRIGNLGQMVKCGLDKLADAT